MNELSMLKKELQPSEMLFIADSMIARTPCVRPNSQTPRLTGVILTKLDVTLAAGCAPIRQITGAPVKFVGLGENTTPSKVFIPSGSSPVFSAWAPHVAHRKSGTDRR